MKVSRCHLKSLVLVLAFGLGLPSCYFFRKKGTGQTLVSSSAGVLGDSLGARAGSLDRAALNDLHAITSETPPAGIRPDPDLFARRLLLQYREEGALVAKEIARIEEYRLLLGGANEDFTTVPQETYDSTSLLAELKVAEEICSSLVAPSAREHPGWDTILPEDASSTTANIRFLAQRILGKPSDLIRDEDITRLEGILDAYNTDSDYDYSDYVPVCATLVIDAEALLL